MCLYKSAPIATANTISLTIVNDIFKRKQDKLHKIYKIAWVEMNLYNGI